MIIRRATYHKVFDSNYDNTPLGEVPAGPFIRLEIRTIGVVSSKTNSRFISKDSKIEISMPACSF
jgi:hypothetical protein